MKFNLWLVARAVWCASLVVSLTTTSRTAFAQLDVPVSIEIPVAPTAIKGNGRMHVAYELHLTNFSSAAITLTRLEVIAGDRQIPAIASYDGSELTARLIRPGAPANPDDKRRIAGGLRAIRSATPRTPTAGAPTSTRGPASRPRPIVPSLQLLKAG